MLRPHSYACGQWIAPGQTATDISGPVTGKVIRRELKARAAAEDGA